jgi:ABC-type antimicrobial peptide transport system permease subunit
VRYAARLLIKAPAFTIAAVTTLAIGLVYGARTFDPGAIAIVILTLVLVTGLAVIIPARRATHADPAAALREE